MQLALIRVPNNYSVCVLLSMITFKSLSSRCNNWGRTTAYILAYFGIASAFPLYAAGGGSQQWFATWSYNDYVNSAAFFISMYYMVFFADSDTAVCSAFALHTSDEVQEIVTVKTTKDRDGNGVEDDEEPAVYDERPQNGPTKYNINAIRGGHKEKDAKKDQFGNPIGDEFDLVRDGAMKGYKILVGDFYGSTKRNDMEIVFATGGAFRNVLERKGFTVDYVKKLADFNAKFDPAMYHCAIVICSSGRKGDTPAEVEYMEKVVKFHLAGRGMFLLGDSEPWNAEMDDALRALKAGFRVEGNTPGNGGLMKRLTSKQTAVVQGTFRAHPITAGLRVLFDGNSICYPDKDFDAAVKAGRYEVIGISKQWNTVNFVASSDLATTKGFGRIVIDCAFTKFFKDNFDITAGTARYIANCAVVVSGAADFAEFGPADPETGKCPLRPVNPTEADLDAFVGATK
jgi:hypothetical protein